MEAQSWKTAVDDRGEIRGRRDWQGRAKKSPNKGKKIIARVLKEKRIAKDIKINLELAFIMGPTNAIAVAPHIDKPDANKILSFVQLRSK